MRAHELYRHDGIEFRSVRVRVDEYKFTIDTQDMGPTTEEFWGDADYEFWTTVPREAWGDLLVALAKEWFGNDPRATDKLRDICLKHDIRHEWQLWR